METGISPSPQRKGVCLVSKDYVRRFIGMKSLFLVRPCRHRKLLLLLIASLSVFYGILLYCRDLTFDTFGRACINQPSGQFGLEGLNLRNDSHVDNQGLAKVTLGAYALAIFLGTEPDAKDDDEDSADHYYVGARTLVYQLLYAQGTRFTSPVAVVILAAKGVRESKLQQLRHDGAVVVEVEKMEHSVEIAVPGYHQVFDKLRAFDPTVMPFRKVALLDADMVITRPLDALFHDINATRFPVIINSTQPPASGLPQLPDSYTLAATPDIPGRTPVFPPDIDHEKNRDYFNAGVILSSPSEELFRFYLALLARPELFGHWLPEQDLLNYAHRWDGPMPWRQLDPSWHLIAPTEADFNAGMAILHCKYWQPAADPCHQTSLARRWEMQGYWEGRGGDGT